jgi:hypothetical protein
MGVVMVLEDELRNRLSKCLLGGEIRESQTLALHDAEALLDSMDPRAMDRGDMEDEARAKIQPRQHLLALVHPHVVQHHVHDRHGSGDLPVKPLQEVDEPDLLLALTAATDHMTKPGVEGRQQIQDAVPL